MDTLQVFRKMAAFPFSKEPKLQILETKRDDFENTVRTVFSSGSSIKVLEVSDRITAKRNNTFGEFIDTCKVSFEEMRDFNKTFGVEPKDKNEFFKLRFGVHLLGDIYSNEYANSLVGKKLLIRSMVSNHYTVKSAKVLYDRTVVQVTYDNNDTEVFFDEFPITKAEKYYPDFVNKLSKVVTPETAYMIIFNYRYHLKDRQGLVDDYLENVPEKKQRKDIIDRLKNDDFEQVCLDRLENNSHISNYKIFKMDDKDFVFYKISAVRYY